MKNSLLFGFLAFFAGTLVTYTGMSFTNSRPKNIATTSVQQSSNYAGAGMMGDIDRHFIEQMIPHHQDAITMAQIAQTKAVRPEVRSLASAITETQSTEITEMQQWYQSWFGEAVPQGDTEMNMHSMGHGGMHMGMMGDATDIDSLENATDFDKEFIRQMIPHHQMAVMMASMLASGSNRPEMKALAQSIIDTQTNEINQMRAWYSDWNEE